jgi:hypothetical protein
LDGSLSGGVLFLVHLCTFLVKPLFICLFFRVADGVCRYSLDCSVFYIFHPSLVVELAHFEVQTRARRSTVMRRPYPSVCRLRNVSVVVALCCWHVAYAFSDDLILIFSTYPLVWKISQFVVLVPKNISFEERSDYHFISILPVLVKAVENVMFMSRWPIMLPVIVLFHHLSLVFDLVMAY